MWLLRSFGMVFPGLTKHTFTPQHGIRSDGQPHREYANNTNGFQRRTVNCIESRLVGDYVIQYNTNLDIAEQR